jgi:hypothetical protein
MLTNAFVCYLEAPAISEKDNHAQEDGSPLVSTLLIYHKGRAYAGTQWIPNRYVRRLFEKLDGYHEYRGNPRSLAYMKDLAGHYVGNVDQGTIGDPSMLRKIPTVEQIILLWPDANGMGWFRLERHVFKKKKSNSLVYVLNGRRRLFELTRRQWRTIAFKRFLEKSFLLEFGVLMLFMVTAPLLALWDSILRGVRRIYDPNQREAAH